MINSSKKIRRHFFSPRIVTLSCVLLTITVGILFPRLFAYLPALSGLALGLVLYTYKIPFLNSEKHILACLVATLTLATLSALWSVNPGFSVERALKVALILLPGFLFYIGARTITLTLKQIKILLCCFCLLSLALFIEKILGHPATAHLMTEPVPGFKLNRHFVVVALLSLPFLYFVKQLTFKYKTLTLIILIVFWGIIMSKTDSQTALVSYWVGVLFLFSFPNYKNIIRLFFIGLMILSCVFPLMVKPLKQAVPEQKLVDGVMLEASIIHRFEIWEFSTDSIMKKPLIGHGLDSLRFLKSDKWMPNQQADNALHSHNIILQLWVEFGVMGAIMLVLFLFMAMQKILAIHDLQKRKFYVAVFASATCCAMTGYSFWQSWQLGLFIFLMALSVLIANSNYKNNTKAS